MHDTTLLRLIEDDLPSAEQLLELLVTEGQALQRRDMPTLERILALKQSLIVQLDQHGRRRSELLVSLKLSPDHAGLEAVAARSPHGAALRSQAERLSDLLARCHQANELNGRAIQLQQRSTANQARILMGGEPPSLYNARGTTSRLANQGPLSQA